MNKFVARLTCSVVALMCAVVTAHAQILSGAQPVKFLRYAAISNDGTIAFTYSDDIWIANPDGTGARRLTANVARDFQPRFSPDGRRIARKRPGGRS